MFDLVHDDYDWGRGSEYADRAVLGIRHGASEIIAFFQELGSTFTVERFEPTVIVGDGEDVLAVVAYAVTSTATGVSATMDIHHHFTVVDGELAYFRGSEDTELVKDLITG